MTFNESLTSCLRDNFINFKGRASRSEYWWFTLAFWGYAVIGLLGSFVFIEAGMLVPENPSSIGIIYLLAGAVGLLILMIPYYAVTVRRFHDVGHSGWVYLGLHVGSVVPLIGYGCIGVIVFFCVQKGEQGPNKYGPATDGSSMQDVFA